MSTMQSILPLVFIIYNTHQVHVNPLSKEFIDAINNGNHSWKAKQNFPQTASIKVIQRLMGSSLDDKSYRLMPKIEYKLDPGETIPTSFDSRQRWQLCPSIHDISEQGSCGSCWAVIAAATMTDRYCIFSNQTLHNRFSAHNILSCCINLGCSFGGEISVAWQYWSLFGVVSGGPYGSTTGCQPYTSPPCNFATNCNKTIESPICEHNCQENYTVPYKEDKKYAQRIYAIKGGERQMQMAIMKYGPVQTVMSVYEDFLSYKSGVYSYVTGKVSGGHSVKLIGWGEEKGLKYWIAANSWGTRWGDNGFFNILRGVDHCDVESVVMAGDPIIYQDKTSLRVNIDSNVNVKFAWNIEI